MTYDIFSGTLEAHSSSGGPSVITEARSGASRWWFDSEIKQHGSHGSLRHVHGGPIPPGRWEILAPGTPHPDGGTLRPHWIPLRPLFQTARTHLYIHPSGAQDNLNTEGCIVVRGSIISGNISGTYRLIYDMVVADRGGELMVERGDTCHYQLARGDDVIVRASAPTIAASEAHAGAVASRTARTMIV